MILFKKCDLNIEVGVRMSNVKINYNILFEEKLSKDQFNQLVIRDTEEKKEYSLDEIKNKIIWGDAFKILKKRKIKR